MQPSCVRRYVEAMKSELPSTKACCKLACCAGSRGPPPGCPLPRAAWPTYVRPSTPCTGPLRP